MKKRPASESTQADDPSTKRARPSRVLVFMDLGARGGVAFDPIFIFEMSAPKWAAIDAALREKDEVMIRSFEVDDLECDVVSENVKWTMLEAEVTPEAYAARRAILTDDFKCDLEPPRFQLNL
jgi:hypothetical protein